jgi:hypothetical protein
MTWKNHRMKSRKSREFGYAFYKNKNSQLGLSGNYRVVKII